MDNNNPNPIQSGPVTPQPTTPIVPTPEPSPVTPSNSDSNKVFWLVGGLLVLSLITAGLYFYMNKSGNTIPQTQQTTKNPTPSPQASLDSLDKDLQSVDVSSTDDLSSIDQDLKSL